MSQGVHALFVGVTLIRCAGISIVTVGAGVAAICVISGAVAADILDARVNVACVSVDAIRVCVTAQWIGGRDAGTSVGQQVA